MTTWIAGTSPAMTALFLPDRSELDRAANTVQAAENHNSSRSNRGQNLMPAGNTGGEPAPAAQTHNGTRSNVKLKAEPGGNTGGGPAPAVGVKEEGVKSK